MDDCSSFIDLIPEVEIREVTIKPTALVGDEDVIVSIRLAVVENQVAEGQSLWFDDIELTKAMDLKVGITETITPQNIHRQGFKFPVDKLVEESEGTEEDISETGEPSRRSTIIIVESRPISLKEISDLDISAAVTLNITELLTSYGLDAMNIEEASAGALSGTEATLRVLSGGKPAIASVQDLRSLANKSVSGNQQESFVKNTDSAKRELDSLLGGISKNISDAVVRSTLQGRRSYVSNLWTSADKNNNFRYAFAFDTDAFVRENSEFPNIYKTHALKRLAQEAGSAVENIRVTRRLLKNSTRKSANRLGGQSLSDSFGSDSDIEIIGNLGKELLKTSSLSFKTSSRYDFYSGLEERPSVDLATNRHYKYGIEITFRDESSLLVETIIENLERMSDELLNLFPSIINSKTGQVSEEEERILKEAIFVIMPLAAELLSGNSKEMVNNWAKRLGNKKQGYFSAASPRHRTAKVGEIQKFLSHLSTTLREETNIKKRSTSPTSQGTAGTAKSRRISLHKQEFNGIEKETKTKKIGYDYLLDSDEGKNTGLTIITAAEYEKRIEDESKKIFKNGASDDTSEGRYSHLSPASIITPSGKLKTNKEKEKELYNQAMADIIEFNSTKEENNISSILSSGREVVEKTTASIESFGATVTLDQGSIPVVLQNKQQASLTLDAQILDKDYKAAKKLEKETAFVTKKKAMPTFNKPLLNVLGNMAIKPVGKGAFKKDYNSIASVGAALNKRLTPIASPHALALKKASGAIFKDGDISSLLNITIPKLDVGLDPMKDFDNFAMFWLTLKQVCVVEYFTGFGKGLQDENWEELTKSALNGRGDGKFLLCRFKPFSGDEAKAAGIGTLDSLDAPLFNEHFLISGKTKKIRFKRIIRFQPIGLRKINILKLASKVFYKPSSKKIAPSKQLSKQKRFSPNPRRLRRFTRIGRM